MYQRRSCSTSNPIPTPLEPPVAHPSTANPVPATAPAPLGHSNRLVVLGNKQEYGLDYIETFALVAKMTTMQTILALVTSQSWHLHHMDSEIVAFYFPRKRTWPAHHFLGGASPDSWYILESEQVY